MTAPMMPSAPPVRMAAPSRSESRDSRESDSAAPFATALDGAMADGSPSPRVPPRDAGGSRGREAADNPGRHLARGHEDALPSDARRTGGTHRRHDAPDPADPASDSTDAPGPTDTPPPAGVAAGLWALLLAAASAGQQATVASSAPADSTLPGAAPAASPVPVVGDTAAGAAAPDPAAALLSALTTDPTVPAAPTATVPSAVPASRAPVGPSATTVAGSAPLSARPFLPVAPAGADGPADPAAAFGAAVATAGATVTAVTTAAPPVVLRPQTAPVHAGTDSDTTVALPLAGVPDGPPPVPVTGGQSSGTGNPDQDGGTSDPSQDGVPDLAGLAPGTSAAPVTSSSVSEAARAPALPAPPVSGQIAQHIAVLRGVDDGEHSMTLVLTPERLGPVEIQVTVSKGSLDLSLRGAHEQGRAALLEALPDLRRDLESAGLTCSRLEVDRTTGGAFTSVPAPTTSSSSGGLGQSAAQMSQQQSPGQRGGQQNWSDGRFPPGLRTADSGDDSSVPLSTRSTSPGVDVRV